MHYPRKVFISNLFATRFLTRCFTQADRTRLVIRNNDIAMTQQICMMTEYIRLTMRSHTYGEHWTKKHI